MRNSISVALVVVSIIVAVTSTFCGGITEAHAAGGFVAVNGGFGLLLALFLGLVGIAIKPSNGPSKADVTDIEWLTRVQPDFCDISDDATFFLTGNDEDVGLVSEGIEVEAGLLKVGIAAPLLSSYKVARPSAHQREVFALKAALKAAQAAKDEQGIATFGIAIHRAMRGLPAFV